MLIVSLIKWTYKVTCRSTVFRRSVVHRTVSEGESLTTVCYCSILRHRYMYKTVHNTYGKTYSYGISAILISPIYNLNLNWQRRYVKWLSQRICNSRPDRYHKPEKLQLVIWQWLLNGTQCRGCRVWLGSTIDIVSAGPDALLVNISGTFCLVVGSISFGRSTDKRMYW